MKGVEESWSKAVISSRVEVWLGLQWPGMSVGPQKEPLITKIRKIKNEEGAVDRAVAPLFLTKGKGYSLAIIYVFHDSSYNMNVAQYVCM